MNEAPKSETNTIRRIYPEVQAGGFVRSDGTVAFYSRINALLKPEDTVLDFGAGRGVGLLDDTGSYRFQLRHLRGKVARVVGVDIDRAVLDNPGLDEAHVIDESQPIPLEDSSVNIVIADFVLEHFTDPASSFKEIGRILVRDGWFCARTPNRYGYVATAARLMPRRVQDRLLRRAQPDRKDEDVFSKYYRANTARALKRLAADSGMEPFIYAQPTPPSYFSGNLIAAWLLATYDQVAPEFLRNNIFIFARKVA